MVLIWAIDLYFMIKWFWISYLFLPISGMLKFDMKIFMNVARLEIGHLFTQGTRWGHPCTLDTILVQSLFVLAQISCVRCWLISRTNMQMFTFLEIKKHFPNFSPRLWLIYADLNFLHVLQLISSCIFLRRRQRVHNGCNRIRQVTDVNQEKDGPQDTALGNPTCDFYWLWGTTVYFNLLCSVCQKNPLPKCEYLLWFHIPIAFWVDAYEALCRKLGRNQGRWHLSHLLDLGPWWRPLGIPTVVLYKICLR